MHTWNHLSCNHQKKTAQGSRTVAGSGRIASPESDAKFAEEKSDGRVNLPLILKQIFLREQKEENVTF
jgi:hypothetical protein